MLRFGIVVILIVITPMLISSQEEPKLILKIEYAQKKYYIISSCSHEQMKISCKLDEQPLDIKSLERSRCEDTEMYFYAGKLTPNYNGTIKCKLNRGKYTYLETYEMRKVNPPLKLRIEKSAKWHYYVRTTCSYDRLILRCNINDRELRIRKEIRRCRRLGMYSLHGYLKVNIVGRISCTVSQRKNSYTKTYEM